MSTDVNGRERDSNGRLLPMANPTSNYIRYGARHRWVNKRFGKATYCSFDPTHKAKRYEWASKSRECLLDLSDYFPLCPSCHRKYDFKESTRDILKVRSIGNTNKRIRVLQFTKDGEFIESFPSLQIASEQLKISRTSISNNLTQTSKSAGGFVWKYE